MNGEEIRLGSATYQAKLSLRDTEIAIKILKDYFENTLADELNLIRVSAPIFVTAQSGLNDNLSGIERPIAFDVPAMSGETCEIVHSLAKWKRMALHNYKFDIDDGLYTDMNAIRRDEILGNLHSLYVDQWDWEKIINHSDRNEEYLTNIVNQIYGCIIKTNDHIRQFYPVLDCGLPEQITIITTQELEDLYPNLTPKERENAITKDKKAVFIMKIGSSLSSGVKHDERAPDYDDWSLNGDILVWHQPLEMAMELSSMGIRVDEHTLMKQLKATGCEDRMQFPFHRELLAGRLPQTIGGGIGQSRLCMFFLEKVHIGEVQASVWSDEIIAECEAQNIKLL